MRKQFVIVDMQTSFSRSYNTRLRKAIRKNIRLYKKTHEIVFLKVKYFGDIHPDLLRAAGEYTVKTKSGDDGSKTLKGDIIVLCGVNREFCVAATYYGCIRKGKSVLVLEEACR